MVIIDFLQRFSNPVLDIVMRIITEAGDVTFAIVIGVIFFWLIDKKFAYKMMITFLFSAGINSSLKEIFKRPRPFDIKPEVDITNQQTIGYSFPSGHSQNIAVMGTMVSNRFKDRLWLKITALVLVILVPLTRLYLGQHFIEDVLVGLVLGVLVAILAIYVLNKFDGYEDYVGLGLIPLFIVLMIVLKDNNQVFIASGALIGLSVGYFLEKRFVDYDVKAPLKIQIFKLVIGLAVALGLKEGLKVIFNLIAKDNNILDAIRYGLVALWASLGAMALFKAIFPNKNKVEEQLEPEAN